MSSTIDPKGFKSTFGVSPEEQEEWVRRYLQKMKENTEQAKYREFQAATSTPETLKESFRKNYDKFDHLRLDEEIRKLNVGEREYTARPFTRAYRNYPYNLSPDSDAAARLNMKLDIDPETGDIFSVRYDPTTNHYELAGFESGKGKRLLYHSPSRDYVKELAHLRVSPDGYVSHAGATYQGVKKKVMDRLIMEAVARDMAPHSNNLSSAGTRFVARWKDKFERGKLDDIINKFAKTGKVTNKFWAALPIIGKALTLGGIAAAPNPAEAAFDFGLDMASGGVLAPGELGRGTLPPHEVAKQKSYNAKIKLQKLKERQQLRQQKRMSNESTTSNLY